MLSEQRRITPCTREITTPTTNFQQGQTSSVGNFTGYAWSNAANWTNGVPANGDTVVFNQGTVSNPDGYDDIPSLYLDNLTLTQGFLSATGTLEIGALAFASTFGEISTTTLPGNSTALLTIDGFANADHGYVEAVGAGATRRSFPCASARAHSARASRSATFCCRPNMPCSSTACWCRRAA